MSASITSGQVAASDGQKKQIRRLLEDAVLKVQKIVNLDTLSNRGAQQLIAHGDKLVSAMIDAVRELSISDQFANEEVASTYGYPSGYGVKGITEQANILRQYFPGVGFANEKLAEQPLPEGAEGWFTIPRWETIASTYGEAVARVLATLAKQRNSRFSNYCEGKLDTPYLRQTEAAMAAFQQLGEEQQSYDLLVVPAQFGLRHRGSSVRRAREVMHLDEFGLGAFAVGIMLLTHPERLVAHDDLWIDCAGDEYDPDGGGRFGLAPLFYFDGAALRFGTFWFGGVGDRCGSASGFRPAVAVAP